MCLHPFTRRFVNMFGIEQTIDCPCGKCIECVKSLQDMWKCRLMYEDKKYLNTYFFTLTYSDDNVPMSLDEDSGFYGTTGRKKDVQDWLKRWRQNVLYKRCRAYSINLHRIPKSFRKEHTPRFSYFICCEYGPEGNYVDSCGRVRQSTCRPHYHGLLFTDLNFSDCVSLMTDWRKRYGYVDFKRLKYRVDATHKASACANYVSKYCCKGEFSSRVDDINLGLIEPAWRIMSKGIGDNYLTRESISYHKPFRLKSDSSIDAIDLVISRLRFSDGNFFYKLPRYYKERIFGKRINCLVRTYDKKTKTYGLRKAQRWSLQTEACVVMQNRIRNRIDKDYMERHAFFKSHNPSLSDSEIDLLIVSDEVSRTADRAKAILAKLNKFYFENGLKNPDLH